MVTDFLYMSISFSFCPLDISKATPKRPIPPNNNRKKVRNMVARPMNSLTPSEIFMFSKIKVSMKYIKNIRKIIKKWAPINGFRVFFLTKFLMALRSFEDVQVFFI